MSAQSGTVYYWNLTTFEMEREFSLEPVYSLFSLLSDGKHCVAAYALLSQGQGAGLPAPGHPGLGALDGGAAAEQPAGLAHGPRDALEDRRAALRRPPGLLRGPGQELLRDLRPRAQVEGILR